MFHSWRRSPWFVQEPLCDHAGDPGGGGGVGDPPAGDPGGHPDYDVDFGDPPDDPAGDPPQGARGAPVHPPAPGTPQGGGPDPRTPQTYTADQYNAVVGRFSTLESNFQQLQASNTLLQRQIHALTGVQPPAPPAAGRELTEADRKAIAAVERLFPGLGKIVQLGDKLTALPDTVESFRGETESRWQDLGTRMWDLFDQECAKAYSLQVGQSLHPFAKRSLDSAFVTWLETDKAAGARYRAGDTTLPAEFVRLYRQSVALPAHRAGTPPAPPRPGQRPGQMPPRVPRGGPGAAVAGQRPAQPNPKNADEVHDAAADSFFAQRS